MLDRASVMPAQFLEKTCLKDHLYVQAVSVLLTRGQPHGPRDSILLFISRLENSLVSVDWSDE